MATPTIHPNPADPAPVESSPRRGEILITADGRRALELRLERLRAARESEYAERLRAAREFGEAGANDDYLAILEDEAVIDSQIARLEELLGRATVIGEQDLRRGAVAIGSIVEVGDMKTRATHRYRVVDAFEGGGKGTVTAGSPIGEALIGREIGDVVEIALPSGGVRELSVLKIEALESDGTR